MRNYVKTQNSLATIIALVLTYKMCVAAKAAISAEGKPCLLASLLALWLATFSYSSLRRTNVTLKYSV